jgi:hypothetical protein
LRSPFPLQNCVHAADGSAFVVDVTDFDVQGSDGDKLFEVVGDLEDALRASRLVKVRR